MIAFSLYRKARAIVFLLSLLVIFVCLPLYQAQTPTSYAQQDNPIQVLSDDNNFFLKIDLFHPAVQPWVVLANNDSGGLQPLYKMAQQFERFPQWAIINADLFSHGCINNVNCAQGVTYIRGQRKGTWPDYDRVYTIRGNIGFDQWNSAEINVHEEQTKRYMTVGGGPRVLIGGGEPTCSGEVRGNKTFFAASGEWFDDDATWWCYDQRSISLLGYSADRRSLYMGMSLGGQTVTQVAQWLKDRGAFEILRLDSGGSSQMFFNGHYIHGIGSQRERRIANAFAIIIDINTPTLDQPTNGATLSQPTVTFRWRNYGFDPPIFFLQVKDRPDMLSGGTTILYEKVYGTEFTTTIGPEWYGKELYWSMVAGVPGEYWARPHNFRIVPE